MEAPTPVTQDLVLIGGGHSHAIALRMWGMNPIPGARLTLITDVMHTPYSGMLPGYVAGLYEFDECHIDLRPLARFAGVRLIGDRAVGLDLAQNRVLCAHHPAIAFDWLSIDIGSTPAVSTVPGAAEYAIPVKPISQFLTQWEAIVQQVSEQPQRPLRLGIVGGGAGGVELALNIRARLRQVLQQAGHLDTPLEIHLVHRGREILPERSPGMRRKMQHILAQRGIQLHLGETVAAVEPDGLRCESGRWIECDRPFWVTQASAASWLKESGLATDDRGFIQVNDCLQSISHPYVFAAGDVATMVRHPRPKAGVFAVRQGKPLVENLRRALLGQPPKPFVPQKEFLILVGLGDCTAVASRGPLHVGPTPWFWQWKDRIDRRFMEKFSNLPEMRSQRVERRTFAPSRRASNSLPCAGCGSKIGSQPLDRALQRVQAEYPALQRDDILIGLDTPDDAAAVEVPAGWVLLQTVDYFRALVDDPFVFGQIAANHALSDLFAMGASPQSALAIATLPYATPAKQEEMLVHLLAGATKVLHAAGAVLMGGHTVEGAELALGFACNGLAESSQLLPKGGLRPGDVLILTKPLGTGTLFAAEMQRRAKGRWIEGAITTMLQSNQTAAKIFQGHGAHACTDVTGFGLLGHLVEMLRASEPVGVQLDLSALPLLPGAAETLQQGFRSSLHPQNLAAACWVRDWEQRSPSRSSEIPADILFDPQTAGGLLGCVPAETAPDCLSALHQAGYLESRAVAQVIPSEGDVAPQGWSQRSVRLV
ncbi:selenide, water dikinase SelD [Thermoleptolyngbya sichuanensis A183]|uniref:Selenide, water dikinase SelD n=1 Tax=Thermoleptolyngbya sichuanensis A183 TaxID=2737172 RepID=A0A6M8BBM2_9CYAN|nr:MULTISPECIES: selenide, water dikinase SelD [Thermoleptolyngbya]QKD82207.1 selenide, water dikinase SelD [Thermoleptolyngbya sichuanensis A183]